MTFPRVWVSRILPLALAACVAIAPVGCGGGEGVNSYTVPKATDPGKKGDMPATGEYRILGALYPSNRPEWYFKFNGTAEQVASHEADFDKMAKTVKLQGDGVPAFDLPNGWVRTGPRVVNRGGVQIKTDEVVKIGSPDAALEVTISFIPGGGTQQNLNRWADQLGIPHPGDAEMKKATAVFDANGTKGLRVDLRGAKNPSGGGMPPFMKK